MFKDFTFWMDLWNNKSLYASPSSIIKLFLITFSSVIKFPNIFILSTYTLSKSSKLIKISILLSGCIIFSYFALIKTKSFSKINSLSSLMWFCIILDEYFLPFNLSNFFWKKLIFSSSKILSFIILISLNVNFFPASILKIN